MNTWHDRILLFWLKFSVAVGAVVLALVVFLGSLVSTLIGVGVLLAPLWVPVALGCRVIGIV